MVELIEKKKVIEYLDEEIRRLSKFDLTKGGMNSGFAVAIISIKGRVEEGAFDCTDLIETTNKGDSGRSFVLPDWRSNTTSTPRAWDP